MKSVNRVDPIDPPPATAAGTDMVRLILIAGLFVILEFLLINGVLLLLGQASIFDQLSKGLTTSYLSEDSWRPMRQAYRWFMEPQSGTIYQDIFFDQHVKFQYSPTSLLFFVVANHLHIPTSNAVLNWIGEGVVFVEAAAVGSLAWLLAARSETIRDDWRVKAGCAGIAAFSCLVFYPVLTAYDYGQLQTWINTGFALACICWLIGWRAAAGLLIGAVCLLKPQFALFLIWGILRRQWSFLSGWMVIVIPGLLISIHEFGFANHLDYIRVLRYIALHGEAYNPNQTVNGLLNRMLFNGTNLYFNGHQFAPYHPVVYVGTLISSGILTLLALFWRATKGGANILDFLIAGLTFTLASPVGWEHHFGILPPIFVSLFFVLAGQPPSTLRRNLLIVLAAAFVFAANYFKITESAAATHFNFIQSYLFFAASTVLWLLYRLRGADAAI
jgi:hypothetical protein